MSSPLPPPPLPPPTYTTHPYTPHHAPPAPFPYTTADMTPLDPGRDAAFYAQPRFVTHIDDHAAAALRRYYDRVLPERGTILDFCSSWVSHYPARIEEAVASGAVCVLGVGMNAEELAQNVLLHSKGKRWEVQDLNADPQLRLPAAAAPLPPDATRLDAATCVVSVDYLTRPVEVLEGIRGWCEVGASVHLAVSNRCFPTKVVARWLKVGEDERLRMVADYLVWSGWEEVEVVTVVEGGGGDPLWVVKGVNRGAQ